MWSLPIIPAAADILLINSLRRVTESVGSCWDSCGGEPLRSLRHRPAVRRSDGASAWLRAALPHQARTCRRLGRAPAAASVANWISSLAACVVGRLTDRNARRSTGAAAGARHRCATVTCVLQRTRGAARRAGCAGRRALVLRLHWLVHVWRSVPPTQPHQMVVLLRRMILLSPAADQCRCTCIHVPF